jgi:hypothetical protein
MMQCVTCNKSSLFVPKLKSIEKIKQKMNILARQKTFPNFKKKEKDTN